MHLAPTWFPTLTFVAAAPTRTATPASSCPGTQGKTRGPMMPIKPDDADQVPCDGVQISVADASECLVDLNFVRAEVAAGEGHGLEVAVGGGARHV